MPDCWAKVGGPSFSVLKGRSEADSPYSRGLSLQRKIVQGILREFTWPVFKADGAPKLVALRYEERQPQRRDDQEQQTAFGSEGPFWIPGPSSTGPWPRAELGSSPKLRKWILNEALAQGVVAELDE